MTGAASTTRWYRRTVDVERLRAEGPGDRDQSVCKARAASITRRCRSMRTTSSSRTTSSADSGSTPQPTAVPTPAPTSANRYRSSAPWPRTSTSRRSPGRPCCCPSTAPPGPPSQMGPKRLVFELWIGPGPHGRSPHRPRRASHAAPFQRGRAAPAFAAAPRRGSVADAWSRSPGAQVHTNRHGRATITLTTAPPGDTSGGRDALRVARGVHRARPLIAFSRRWPRNRRPTGQGRRTGRPRPARRRPRELDAVQAVAQLPVLPAQLGPGETHPSLRGLVRVVDDDQVDAPPDDQHHAISCCQEALSGQPAAIAQSPVALASIPDSSTAPSSRS